MKKVANAKYDYEFHKFIKRKALEDDKTIRKWTAEIAKRLKGGEEVEEVFKKKKFIKL
ncbi:MAG: hypothetical protein ACTSYG_07565 [Candidatus Heimdallarchaeota archaeon]